MGTPPYDYPLMSYPTSYVYGVDMYGGYVDIDQFCKHVSCTALSCLACTPTYSLRLPVRPSNGRSVKYRHLHAPYKGSCL